MTAKPRDKTVRGERFTNHMLLPEFTNQIFFIISERVYLIYVI